MNSTEERKEARDAYDFTPDERLESASDTTTYFGRTSSGNRAVLKELDLSHARTWKAVELFERETKHLKRLDHPRIPTYRDSSVREEDDGVRFAILRDYVPGTTVEEQFDAVEPEPLWDDGETRAFLDDVLEILAYLHGLQPPVVHRDIRPAHLVESETGAYHLVGFGSIQAVLPRTEGGSTFVGSRGYMPVEQMMGRARPASDLYALGMTALQCRTGLRPDHLRARDGSVSLDAVPDLEPELRSLLQRLVAADPDRRPRTGGAARRLLERGGELVPADSFEPAIGDDTHPAGTEVVETADPGVLIELQSPSPNVLWYVFFLLFGAIVWATGPEPALLLLMVMTGGGAGLGHALVRGRNAAIEADREGLATNTLWSVRIGRRRFDWEELGPIRSVRVQGQDLYAVVAPVQGRRQRIASFLTGEQAEWLADRLESLRKCYKDDGTGPRARLESAD